MLSEEEIEKINLEECINILKYTDISTPEMAENTDLFTYSYAVKEVLKYIEKLEKYLGDII